MNRNGLKVMYKLIGLVLPLVHVMIAAITMGVIGFLTAIFIIVLGGVGLLYFRICNSTFIKASNYWYSYMCST